jgi:hypothetical protein
MTGTRVILLTISGPGGQVDVGVRADATPAELVTSLGGVLGVGLGGAAAEHHAPPRPGVPRGTRAALRVDMPLTDGGVVDGDMILFRNLDEALPGAHAPQGTGTNEPDDRG